MLACGRKRLIVSGYLVNITSLVTTVHADITGFGTFSNFTINRTDTGSAPTLTPGMIRMTSLGEPQSRSIYFNTVQNISKFTASFTYRSVEGPVGGFSTKYGATFVVQNSPGGLNTAVGNGNNLGYGNDCVPFGPCARARLLSIGVWLSLLRIAACHLRHRLPVCTRTQVLAAALATRPRSIYFRLIRSE